MQPESKRNRFLLRSGLLLGSFMLAGGALMAAEPDLAPKTVNIGEEFLGQLRILAYILVVIAILVGNIVILMAVKDSSKLTLKHILGHFVGKDATDPEMHHEYDGIRELDNPVPAWLAWLFYASIFFAVVYMIHYHFMGTGPSSREEYEYEMAVAAEKYKDVELPESAILQVTDAGRLQASAAIFTENCATCHGEKLEGLTGPNLADAYWLHGGDVKSIYKTISEGVPGKTMIGWKGKISSNDRLGLASYILSLQGTTPPNAKAPEGTLAGAEAPATPADSAGTGADSLANAGADSATAPR